MSVQLSPRGRQTLALIAAGLTDKEIAGKLGLMPGTIKQYTQDVYERLRLPRDHGNLRVMAARWLWKRTQRRRAYCVRRKDSGGNYDR